MFGTGDQAAPRSPRYRTLDHWRGIACLLVVIFHSSGVAFLTMEQSGRTPSAEGLGGLLLTLTRIGWIGVPFFFVISGYAISATADAHRRKAHGALEFFRRRIRRIYPPYWAMLACQVVLVFAVDVLLRPGLLTTSIAPIARPWELEPGQWLGNLTLTETWRASFLPFRSETQFILGQAWTLCYEEQFYLVAGLSVLAFPRRYFAIAALVSIATIAFGVLGIRARGLFIDGYWLAFAAGVLAYRQLNYGSARSLLPTVGLLLAGIAYAVLVIPDGGELDRDLAAAMIFGLILLGLHRFDRAADARWLRPIRFLGTICYSLYLSHAVIVRSLSQALYDAGLTSPLVTVLIVIPVCVAVAVVVGWGFHRLVERHFLNAPTSPPAPAERASRAGPEGPSRTAPTVAPERDDPRAPAPLPGPPG
jgi:peptidoglycan/LPS O-acetylase OafA/YrhL